MLTSLDGLAYPVELRWILAHGLRSLTPWHFIDEEGARGFRREFRIETAGPDHRYRDILPFALRQDCDDVAGFLVVDGVVAAQVLEVHLTYRGSAELPGYPSTILFPSFSAWLKSAIDDSLDWCNEEELLMYLDDGGSGEEGE